MEFFKQHQTIIFRSVGAFMLLLGFVIHFWATPKDGISANERAAANVARMEAQVKGSAMNGPKQKKADSSKFLEKLKTQQAKQLEYLTVLIVLLGIGSLVFSFLKKDTED
jgi:hypothetical protein